MYGGEIKGLRIHLEEKYKLETTDIWFSSGTEYQGANAQNSIMIFVPEDKRRMEIYDVDRIPKKDVIIATEFLMGYRLFNRDKKITIAIPNRINKKQGQMLLNEMNIDNVEVYIDNHTISCDYLPIYRNLLNYIPEDKQKVNFCVKYNDLIKETNELENKEKVA